MSTYDDIIVDIEGDSPPLDQNTEDTIFLGRNKAFEYAYSMKKELERRKQQEQLEWLLKKGEETIKKAVEQGKFSTILTIPTEFNIQECLEIIRDKAQYDATLAGGRKISVSWDVPKKTGLTAIEISLFACIYKRPDTLGGNYTFVKDYNITSYAPRGGYIDRYTTITTEWLETYSPKYLKLQKDNVPEGVYEYFKRVINQKGIDAHQHTPLLQPGDVLFTDSSYGIFYESIGTIAPPDYEESLTEEG